MIKLRLSQYASLSDEDCNCKNILSFVIVFVLSISYDTSAVTCLFTGRLTSVDL